MGNKSASQGVRSGERGSVLLVALVFLLVFSRMAQGGLDAALAGLQLVVNYRDYERRYNAADSTIALVDAGLLSAISDLGASAGISRMTGLENSDVTEFDSDHEIVRLQIQTLWPAADERPLVIAGQQFCVKAYRITAVAERRLSGSQTVLALERQLCCATWQDCEQGAFIDSSKRVWRN